MYKSIMETLKRQATTWERASANHLPGKGPDPEYIETSKLKNKNKIIWREIGPKIWRLHQTYSEGKKAQETMLNILSHKRNYLYKPLTMSRMTSHAKCEYGCGTMENPTHWW